MKRHSPRHMKVVADSVRGDITRTDLSRTRKNGGLRKGVFQHQWTKLFIEVLII
jgi:hypothetical protein